MAPEDALDVERRSVEAFGDVAHFRRDYKEKNGVWVDETADQPRTGDAIDLGSTTRDP
jgi:hypothetical protein